MRVLVVGRGGREHVVSRHLGLSDLVETVYCAPGNPGMIADGIVTVDINESDHKRLIEFAKANGVDWAFIGPEAPLIAGIVDEFEEARIPAFGPHANAAVIEGSKEFAKELMFRHGIPTGTYRSFTDFEEARDYVLGQGAPIVVKADGLAAGKGVVVAVTMEEAVEALDSMLRAESFGTAGATVVVEEFLEGQEFSLLAFVRGASVHPMVIAQDHKRAWDDDRGPNTGGMGAYSPVPQIPESMVEQAVRTVVEPAARGMVEDGTPFTGILYAGLIATTEGPKVIEFNARFGDPEAQVVLPRLKSDLAQIIDDLLAGREPIVEWDNDRADLGVVVAAEGYPGEYVRGASIPSFDDSVTVDYAGVAAEQYDKTSGGSARNGSGASDSAAVDATPIEVGSGPASPAEASNSGGTGLVSDGGRVYLVKASGRTLQEAQDKVYAALAKVNTDGTFYRTDIGNKAINS
ncbi:phosphoribosylamine--glycine ligase [Actinomycetaceae bacterium MB13-C1-2]|nr:phosphoribosylamine--glycine ligase [Actinomycetaceae bacterium MB13-C1-2]